MTSVMSNKATQDNLGRIGNTTQESFAGSCTSAQSVNASGSGLLNRSVNLSTSFGGRNHQMAQNSSGQDIDRRKIKCCD